MVTFTVHQSSEDKQDTSLCHIQCRERYWLWKQIPTLDDIQWFYLVTMHQKQVPKFSGFKPMKNKPGLSVVCPVSPPSAGVMKQVATTESFKGVRELLRREGQLGVHGDRRVGRAVCHHPGYSPAAPEHEGSHDTNVGEQKQPADQWWPDKTEEMRQNTGVESRSRLGGMRWMARHRHSCYVAHSGTKTEGLSLEVASKGIGESPREASPSVIPHRSFPAVSTKVTQLHHQLHAGLVSGQENPGA